MAIAWMSVWLASDTNTTIEEFIAMVSTQHKQKKNHAKTKKRKEG